MVLKLKRSRLSEQQTKRLIEHFVAGTPARTAAELVDVNRNTATLFYHKLRLLIAQRLGVESPFDGEVEADESWFGGRQKGGKGRPVAGKIPVFGLLKRGGRVYTTMIPNVKGKTLIPIIQQRVMPDSIVYTDYHGGYEKLDVAGFVHRRINKSEAFAKPGQRHVNGIENFWSQAKRHLRKYNGIPKDHFHLFLKECEWRFNYGSPRSLRKSLHDWLSDLS